MSNEYKTDARIIITRAEAQAARIATLIEDAGGTAIRIPALEIRPTTAPDTAKTLFDHIDHYDLVIFISPNAVRYSSDFVDADRWHSRVCLAIGAGTAQAMKLAGIECSGHPQEAFTSEALLELPELVDVNEKNVLIVRGNGGRPLLGNELTQRGAKVDYAEVYSRGIPESSATALNQALRDASADAIIANSVETLSNIVSIVDSQLLDDVRRLQLITGSSRVAQKARELEFELPPLVANGPDDLTLMAAISKWSETNHHANFQTTKNQHIKPTETLGAPQEDVMTELDNHNMSSTEPEITIGSAAEDTSTAHEPNTTRHDKAAEQAVVQEASAQSPGSRMGVAWLALLAALAAGGVSAWNWWTTRNQPQPVEAALIDVPSRAQIEAEIQQATTAQRDRMNEQLDRHSNKVEQALDKQNEFASNLRTQERSVENLTDQLSQMENTISSMRGVSANVRNTWVRAETEYFLQTANTRLQLAGDVKSAIQALRAADERIVALGDPSLTPVRAQLNEELFLLESLPKIDIEGIALSLNSLAQRVDQLPVLNTSPNSFGNPDKAINPEDGTTWDRTKQAFTGALGNIVRFSPSEGQNAALLAPEQTYFLYRNLQLQLQTARMAALQGQQATYDDSVRSAQSWLQDYFDINNSGVSTMMERLEQLSQEQVSLELPDISRSLNMIKSRMASSSVSGPTPRRPEPLIAPTNRTPENGISLDTQNSGDEAEQ